MYYNDEITILINTVHELLKKIKVIDYVLKRASNEL